MKTNDSTAFLYRQYMLEESFELYYYSDYPSRGVAPHTHNFYEFYFFLEGNLEMTIDGTIYRIFPGNVMIIPPGVLHYPSYIDNTVPYRRFVLWIHKSYYQKYFAKIQTFNYLFNCRETTGKSIFYMNNILFNDLQNKIFQLIREMQENRFGKDVQIPLLLQALLLSLSRYLYESSNKPDPMPGTLKSRICSYIDEHLQENLTLDTLSDAFFLNKYYISHTFTQVMGISVHQYIVKKRLEACKNALTTGGSLEKISADYGFTSYSSFFRFFKKEFGVSPRDYREQLRSQTAP